MTTQSKHGKEIQKIPHLVSIIKPGEFIHATEHLVPLSVDTPHGNLQSSWMSILERIIATNEFIDKVNLDFRNFMHHVEAQKNGQAGADHNAISRQKLNGELIINTLKVTADMVLCLLSILDSKQGLGEHEARISISKVGSFLHTDSKRPWVVQLSQFAPLLKELNDTSNAFKHSFLNLQVNTYYDGVPGVVAYYLPHNDLSKKPELCTLLLPSVVEEFDQFLAAVKSQIEKLR